MSAAPSSSVRLQARITNGGGAWTLERDDDGVWIEVATGFNTIDQVTTFNIEQDTPALPAGAYDFRLTNQATDHVAGAQALFTLHVSKATLTFSLTGQTTVETPGPVYFSVNTTHALDAPVPVGEIVVKDVSSGAVVATSSQISGFGVEVDDVPAGIHQYQASFAGSADYAPATSDAWAVTVSGNVAHATSVRLSLTTFYPYKDGYRDTVGISGIRDEVETVAIRVYSPAGKLLKLTSLPSSSGAYATSWNGRSSSGALQPNGKYRILQSLTDSQGGTASYTSYVNLSSERLVYNTTYVNRTIAQAAYRSSSMISWDFQLPAAAVYKSLSLQIDGRTVLIPGGYFGAYDHRPCDGMSGPGCYRSTAGIGFTRKWWAKTLFPDHNRNGTHVTGTVWGGGQTLVYGARVKVTYATLM